MGNVPSEETSSSSSKRKSSSKKSGGGVANRARSAVNDWQYEFAKRLEDQDNPAAQVIDSLCGPYLDTGGGRPGVRSYYSEDASEDDSRTYNEEETTVTDYKRTTTSSSKQHRSSDTVESASYMSQSDYDTLDTRDTSTVQSNRKRSSGGGDRRRRASATDESSYEETDDDTYTNASTAKDDVAAAAAQPNLSKQPLASAFAKRCYFTKQGIGSHTQHYEGLTLTGNVVLMLAAAMKLKGCPTICDEDLRRVEQTYPNQFSRLPDELLLSSGWRRISKYCHFSNKPIPDGIPFFHSKQRLHPSGGYYFLLAAAVGMVRPIDVEPLNRDTLVLLETDYPTQCDAAPAVLIQDETQWTLVDKFCFFSGGPINTDEDVYYHADFDGNPIYMLAFLSPSLTPAELYKLDEEEVVLQTRAAVEEVESVYDLTERDFDDLKLYHLGPCRALPQYILQPQAWTKVLPPHFLAAREQALIRAQDFQALHGYVEEPGFVGAASLGQSHDLQQQSQYGQPPLHPQQHLYDQQPHYGAPHHLQQQQLEPPPSPYGQHHQQEEEHYDSYHQQDPDSTHPMQRDIHEGAYIHDNSVPMDEAIAAHAIRAGPPAPLATPSRMDPPEDEPPSLSKRGAYGGSVSSADPSQRSVYQEGSAYNEGSVYQEGSAYSAYQEGSHQHESYYQEEEYYHSTDQHANVGQQYAQEDGFAGEEYLSDEQYQEHDDYRREDEYQPDDEFYDDRNRTEIRRFASAQQPVKEELTSPISETESVPYSDADLAAHSGEGEFASGSQVSSNSAEYSAPAESTRRDSAQLPPPSPRSGYGSEYTPSSAMRGAQELLRRNRQRRLELARRAKNSEKQLNENPGPDDEETTEPTTMDIISPNSQESGGTWESGGSSELTSGVSGSSVWTDNDTVPDRSSRRALILQMAKARMKSNKQEPSVSDPANEEEKKLEPRDIATDNFDLTGDLD